MWGVLSCLPAQPPGGHWEGRWLDTGERQTGQEQYPKQNIRTCRCPLPLLPDPPDRPPGLFPRHPRAAATPLCPGGRRGLLVRHRILGAFGGTSSPCLSPGKGGSVPAKSDLSTPGPSQPPLEAGAPSGFNQQQRPHDENTGTT